MLRNSPRRLAVALIERQTGCLGRWNVKAGPQIAIGAEETEPGLTRISQCHGRTYLAVPIVELQARRTVRREVKSQTGTAAGIGKIQSDCAVGQDSHRATQLAAAVAQQELLRLHGIGHDRA